MNVTRLKRALRRGVTALDENLVSRVGLALERPALVSFLFHGVFEDAGEIESGIVHPQEGFTATAVAQLIERFAGAGYRFISLETVADGLDQSGCYATLTFDDGYASNLRIVDVLREYDVPATIFVSTRYVETGKRYWWDAIYCERRKRGASDDAIAREIHFLEAQDPDSIEGYVVREFGGRATTPSGDLDRPLTPRELSELSENELVTIGNHTADHVVLTSVTPERARQQLVEAQGYLERVLGNPARTVSYPEGAYDSCVLSLARELGFSCGLTTSRRKDRLPLDAERLLELGRFQFESARDLGAQIRVVRSEVQLANTARRLLEARRP